MPAGQQPIASADALSVADAKSTSRHRLMDMSGRISAPSATRPGDNKCRIPYADVCLIASRRRTLVKTELRQEDTAV